MIQLLRTCRQASPAVVKREPGYCTGAWIRLPASGAWLLGRLLKPSTPAATPRHMGALLPGWTLLRSALFCCMYFGSELASGLTSGLTSRMFWPWMPPGAAGTGSSCGLVWADTERLNASERTQSRDRMSVDLGVFVLALLGARLQVLLPARLVARLPAGRSVRHAGALERLRVHLDAALQCLGL